MKKYLSMILIAACILVSGCSRAETTKVIPEDNNTSQEVSDKETPEEETLAEETASESADEDALSFAEFKNLQFIFSSGAGGWATYLNIHEDGSFVGEYFDSDMGDTGEDYPNGIMYRCDFDGQFTQPVKVNEYTYSMTVQEINYEKEPGGEEIIDGTKYIYSDPYGLYGAEDILIYLPGAPWDELPEDFKSWTGSYGYTLSEGDDSTLPFLGLYNEAEQLGFASYSLVKSVNSMVSSSEDFTNRIDEEIQKESLSQAELNEKAQQKYEEWDNTLNSMWDALKNTLDEETMSALLTEQREWIASKEQAVKEAGAEVEGGSLYPLVTYGKAAELTRERAYELLEYFNE